MCVCVCGDVKLRLMWFKPSVAGAKHKAPAVLRLIMLSLLYVTYQLSRTQINSKQEAFQTLFLKTSE